MKLQTLTEVFIGVCFIGIFGNAAELINAVSFGLKNNIALAIEIGAAGTIQVSNL
jgi:Ca2+/H+ antiporter